MKAVLVISERDNVATALEALEAGRSLQVNGATLVVRELVPPGHKVALTRIRAGEPVVKYGSPIGLASTDIADGAHVHTHNVSSSRGRGDLAAPATGGPEARLAEPPDAVSEKRGARS
ncbi:MAG TPA: UxaA family hydrolase [Vicinamibacterales bacterium]|nr:UxaA family hydrolase [Vicinamibacterales bacterium]